MPPPPTSAQLTNSTRDHTPRLSHRTRYGGKRVYVGCHLKEGSVRGFPSSRSFRADIPYAGSLPFTLLIKNISATLTNPTTPLSSHELPLFSELLYASPFVV